MASKDFLDQLREKRDQAAAAAKALLEAPDYDPDSEALKLAEEQVRSLTAQMERVATLLEAQKNADALDGRFAKAAKAVENVEKRNLDLTQFRSAGQAFIESTQFTDYHGQGRSGVFDFDMTQRRALPTGIVDLVAAGVRMPTTLVDTTPVPLPTPLLDAISKITVSTNAVDFVAWRVVAGGAAKVAEKAAKPSIEYGPAPVSDTLDNIAVYTQLTRQLIEDLPAVRNYIDQDLIRRILIAEEAEVAAALAAATLATQTNPTLLGAIREGVGSVQAAGYAPNAVLLNPADWASLDVDVMGRTLNGPLIRQDFWGLTPIASASQAAGSAVVGDFMAGVTQFVRSNVALYVTDSHADTFLANVFTLLAERRSLAAVVRPQALARVSVGA